MTHNDPQKTDEFSLRKLLTETEGGRTGNTAHVKTAAGAIRMRVSASVNTVRASFDPVSAEQDRFTSELNQIARKGYQPPKTSTR